MPERVTEVEMCPLPFLKRIGRHDFRLDRDIVRNQLGEISNIQLKCLSDRFLHLREVCFVPNDVMLDALGEPAAQLPWRQGGQHLRIDEDRDRLMKRADEIFPDHMIHACLSPDAGIDHRQQRRRHLHERRRRGAPSPRQSPVRIAHDPAAEPKRSPA